MNGQATPLTDQQKAAAQAKLGAALIQLAAAKALLDNDDYRSGLGNDEKLKAINSSLELGDEILRIENAQIADLVADADANIEALDGATSDLGKALTELNDFNRVLSAVSSVLGIALKFVAPV